MEQIHLTISAKTRCQRWSPVDQCPSGRNFQRFDVLEPLARRRHRQLVATHLPLTSQPGREPPDGWVIKENRLSDSLQQVDPQVITPQMGQFMCDNRFQQIRRQLQQPGNRKKDDRPEESHRHGLGYTRAGKHHLGNRLLKSRADGH
jgi:hypothetical protein